MHPTLLRQVQSVSRSLRNLLPTELPPTLSPPQRTNLYEVLSRLPRDSKGVIVHQTRWALTSKDAYWRITQANFKCEGKHGKAWGTLYRNGKIVSRRPEVIRQALKYDWAEGPSVRRPVTSKQSKLKAAPTPTPTPAKSMADVAVYTDTES